MRKQDRAGKGGKAEERAKLNCDLCRKYANLMEKYERSRKAIIMKTTKKYKRGRDTERKVREDRYKEIGRGGRETYGDARADRGEIDRQI